MLFSKKTVLVEHQNLVIGEFNPNTRDLYENVKTFPLEVKKGKNLFVSVKSDVGVDVCFVNTKGYDASFTPQVTDKVIGPVAADDKGTMALILGVGYGLLAHAEIEAWME